MTTDQGGMYDDRYHILRREVEALGLFRRRTGFYIGYSIILTLGLFFCLFAITLSSNFFMVTLVAILLGIVFMQFGFLGHDIAHHQVFSSWGQDRFFGSTVYALALGISLETWASGHYAHHEHTNQIDADPDINLPLVFTEEQLALRGAWYRKWILPYQHLYFFAFMSLAYFNYILRSFPTSFRDFQNPFRLYEWVLIIIHFAVLFGVVFGSLPFWMGVYFLLLTAMVSGAYAGLAFAPNHKGEDVLTPDEVVTYRTMINSTRNIFPSRFTDLALGGLNYQIEHHLFSDIPRPSLPQVQPLVKAFCTREGLPYHQTSFMGSMHEMYSALYHFAKK